MTNKKLISYPAVHETSDKLQDDILRVLGRYNRGKINDRASMMKLVEHRPSGVVTVQNGEDTFCMIVVEAYGEPTLHVDLSTEEGKLVQEILQIMEVANKETNRYNRFNSFA